MIVSPKGAAAAFQIMQNQLKLSKNMPAELIGKILNTETVQDIVEKQIKLLRGMIFKIEHEKGK
jgi:hypothetical protein